MNISYLQCNVDHVDQYRDFITLKVKKGFPTFPKGYSGFYLGKPYTEFVVTNERQIKAKAGVLYSKHGRNFKILIKI